MHTAKIPLGMREHGILCGLWLKGMRNGLFLGRASTSILPLSRTRASIHRQHQQQGLLIKLTLGWHRPRLTLLAESATHWEKLKDLTLAGHISGVQIHDTRIAALCLQHGITEFWSADRDFSRYPELKLRNPLPDRNKHPRKRFLAGG